ncbi:hypothetical protein ABZ924_32080 [Streptomyces sp. NPDC046876]|uniref:hypothetical protein n=1 Tax=Streptomyces sp. NPDC046876 TaxID=3155616 RepID=UPI00340A6AF3
MALPGRAEHGRQQVRRVLADLVGMLGLDVAPEPPDPGDQRRWEQQVRAAVRKAGLEGIVLPDASLDLLVDAAVHEPDPSFNRWFVEPALNAFGYRRVRAVLLDRLRTGTDAQRAGAARAWYWSALPLRLPQVTAQTPHAEGGAEPDDRYALARDWDEAALREFVDNEHLDVRRCILPLLRLRPSAYPPELHGLMEAAVEIARAHEDEYIRHRVEIQVGD